MITVFIRWSVRTLKVILASKEAQISKPWTLKSMMVAFSLIPVLCPVLISAALLTNHIKGARRQVFSTPKPEGRRAHEPWCGHGGLGANHPLPRASLGASCWRWPQVCADSGVCGHEAVTLWSPTFFRRQTLPTPPAARGEPRADTDVAQDLPPLQPCPGAPAHLLPRNGSLFSPRGAPLQSHIRPWGGGECSQVLRQPCGSEVFSYKRNPLWPLSHLPEPSIFDSCQDNWSQGGLAISFDAPTLGCKIIFWLFGASI